jgi:hypothetical protein
MWLWVLWAGLLTLVILGMAFAIRHERKCERQAGSLTELASVQGLRAQVERLKADTRRLRRERDEVLGVLTQLAKLLEQWSEASSKRPR